MEIPRDSAISVSDLWQFAWEISRDVDMYRISISYLLQISIICLEEEVPLKNQRLVPLGAS
jgi:hypothetical protein